MIEIKVPPVGESINEVTLVAWLKKDGDYVKRDEVICELESEKATFELNAEKAGILHIVAEEGTDLEIGALACRIDDEAEAPASSSDDVSAEKEKEENEKTVPAVLPKDESNPNSAKADAPPPPKEAAPKVVVDPPASSKDGPHKATPLANAIMQDKHVDAASVKGSGANGRIERRDVLAALQHPGKVPSELAFSREESTKKMSNLRRTISRRLVEAKNLTAMLTTFNEVDMTEIMAIRTKYKEDFKKKHGVGLGFMSFFTKAASIALQEWPAVNSYIDGDNIISHDFVDISIAVSAPKGLVVPVIRNAESLSMYEIEQEVVNLATKARESKLTMEEMTGGTFTLTNGGVFGSLLSTPIINIPQAAILGMHKIQDRVMVLDGEMKIRPMMYLALSYDHRVIDGRESVGFLVRIKELLENPQLMLIKKDPVAALLEM